MLHQVCSSDLLDNRWITILRGNTQNVIFPLDWRKLAWSQFNTLSTFCDLANKTIDDATNQFIFQSCVVSNVLTESDFDSLLNVTLNHFFQSTIFSYSLLIQSVHLLTQIDQPYQVLSGSQAGYYDPNLIGNLIKYEANDSQSLQVYYCSCVFGFYVCFS